MARIRTVKPEFWTDETLVEMSPLARLLFIGLWNFADDQGYLDYKPKQIKMRVLPADDADIDALIAELLDAGRVAAYSSPLGPQLRIVHWARHQRVEKAAKARFDPAELRLISRSAPEELGKRPEESGKSPEDSGNAPLTSGSPTPPEDSGKPPEESGAEGNGREGNGKDLSSPPAPDIELIDDARIRRDEKAQHETETFDRFWGYFPRKEGKIEARKAWPKAIKVCDAELIIKATTGYRERCREKETQFVKMPAPWLNAQRWLDELDDEGELKVHAPPPGSAMVSPNGPQPFPWER